MAIQNNKYIPLIMQSVNMLAADALRQQDQYRQSQLSQQRRQQEEEGRNKRDAINRKFSVLSSFANNKNLTPESRQNAANAGVEMLSNPDTDISGLQFDMMPTEQKKTYGIDPEQAKYYGIPADGYSLGDAIDVATRYRDDLMNEKKERRLQNDNNRSGRQKSTVDLINDAEKKATDRYNRGEPGLTFDMTGAEKQINRPIDERTYQMYLSKLSELRQKAQSGAEWTAKDQENLNSLINFDLWRKKMQKVQQVIDKEGGLKPQKSHNSDPLGLRDLF